MILRNTNKLINCLAPWPTLMNWLNNVIKMVFNKWLQTLNECTNIHNILHYTISLGIKIILDFVPNHTSEEHEWFIKSVKKIDPYTDYYVWADAKYENGTRQVPNNWVRQFCFVWIGYWYNSLCFHLVKLLFYFYKNSVEIPRYTY